jgi:glyoxylase-like metal-dependent hydrolase (beta-lactamase superfamily II)
MYLLIGNDKVALIDTGCGLGSLRSYISQILSRTVDLVIITHGHVDHASGAGEFADIPVYMHPADKELMKIHTIPKTRTDYAKSTMKVTDIPESDIMPVLSPDKTIPLENGQVFDLGGLTIEAIHTPGHTQGMMMMLMKEERTILFGDACGVCVLLLEECASSVEEYRDSLMRVKPYEKYYDTIIRNHGTCVSPKELLDNVIECCNLILDGKDDHMPVSTENMPFECNGAFMAKTIDPNTRMRIDGVDGNIMYIPEKVFK